MQMMNCPRCNMVLAPGAQVCSNCHLNLQQYAYQQQMAHHHSVPVNASGETAQEKKYRIILVIIVFLSVSNLVYYRIPDLLDDWFHIGLYQMLRPLSWIATLAWAGVPLTISILLPKTNKLRILLIVLSSIWAVWDLSSFVYYEWFYEYAYNPYDF